MLVFRSLPFDLVLQIAPVENDNSYDELKRDAKMCLSLMSQGLLYPQQVPLVLQVLKQVSLIKTAQSFVLSGAFLLFCLFIIINCLNNCVFWEVSVEKKIIWKRKVTLFATFPQGF